MVQCGKDKNMSSLQKQVDGLIKTCKTALARRKDLPDVDVGTIHAAEEILKQAKDEFPDDKVLAAVKLEPPFYPWAEILSAMETVRGTLHGGVSSLPHHAAGLIETCKTVLARGKDLPNVEATTFQIAVAILDEAKRKCPDDKVLAAVNLEGPLTWTAILSAMETVSRTLDGGRKGEK